MNATKPVRKRAIQTATEKVEIPNELKKLAVDFYTNNKVSNAAKGKADKARKALYAGMKEGALLSFDFLTNVDGAELLLEAKVGAKEETYVDITELAGLVKSDVLLQIVSASLKAVEEHAGKEVLARCTHVRKCAENVSVGPKK